MRGAGQMRGAGRAHMTVQLEVTVRRVLDLEVVRAGEPEVLAGADRLENTVRWVHIAELKDLSGLLQGGELVLTAGLALGDVAAETAAYLGELARAGASGVIVELLPGRRQAAEALRAAATGAALPVIMVSRRVRFVDVTEVVHRLIVARQLEAVERARHVHEVFTELSLAGAGPEEIVARTAELIGAAAVLEDLSHLVIAYAGAGVPAQELLGDWQRRSRHVGYRESTSRAGDEGWLQTPVGLRDQRWGRLIVPAALDDDDGARMVLERAGQALSISRMAERDQRELGHQAQAGLLHELRQSRILTESEALTRAAALGLRPAPVYVPIVIRLDRQRIADPMVLQRRERDLLELVNAVLKAASMSALAASLHTGSVGILLAVPAKQLEESMLERLCQSLVERAASESPGLPWTVGVGRGRDAVLTSTTTGLDEAIHVAETAGTLGGNTALFYRSSDIRLRGLLALLRDDPRVQAFVEAELAGIFAGGDGDGDLDLLAKFLESGGNKAAMARSGYLSRPTLYARLAKLAKKLGADLNDAESRTSLHVALLLHRLQDL